MTMMNNHILNCITCVDYTIIEDGITIIFHITHKNITKEKVMGKTLIEKLIASHLVAGEMIPGKDVGLKIDHTLTQDATGTMAYIQFEALGVPRVRTELSVSYLDHQLGQVSFENADDHRFLQSIAAKYGLVYSRPGNGICHQVHLERFGVPGKTLIGSDSHTPTAGGIGMLAFGAGGMDVALTMAGTPFNIKMPQIVNVELTGTLRPWVSGKDVILEMLRRLTVRGGVNKAFEYTGPGLACLSVPARSAIANMGTELGATTSVFVSDEVTHNFLKAQHREKDWTPLYPDEDAVYADKITIDLSNLEPMIAQPHMPDRVVPVSELEGHPLDQVFIGSCTNSSYFDLVKVARIMKGKVVAPNVEMALSPGSKQVFEMAARSGVLADLIASGVRILEVGCTACGGGGFAPNSTGISMRSSCRNFIGRSGTRDAQVYLASSETCAASALAGFFTTAEPYSELLKTVQDADEFIINDNMFVVPPEDGSNVEILRGPNIKALPSFKELDETIRSMVVSKLGNDITTDDIIPATAEIVKYRSNIGKISEYVLTRRDPEFYKKITARGNGIIIAGENYGQGSSREHAALAPKYLGVKAIISKSFARIHVQNLANFGILPLNFVNFEDYEKIDPDDELEIANTHESLHKGRFIVRNLTKGLEFEAVHPLTAKQQEIVIAGGLLRYTKERSK